ncbi:polysaccharide deacetylase family protein [Phytohabitans sp. ZYX-F-186]|uniref:Polysaccharide deacetylase family protein n=1 Tax=Phytohabitans maris TaxID=3071409 RepID=A0ABU0ZI21_9ACTN|nr:polysaccharide deacetylase family protein [Phytohabitans sp. ZYX-F-186]MDQ7906672.1 polysaccharide deacetylase family protein [Phytohabitans sp. ZYX-F-186]
MSNVRTVVIVAGVIAAIVASAYLIGHRLGSDTAKPRAEPTAEPAAGAPQHVAAAPRPPDAPPPPPMAVQPFTGPGRPPLPAERGGPFGSRLTTGTPEVALTFDDGPDPSQTPQALALLRRYGVKATFCLVGVNVKAFPALVRRIVGEGHTLCNHSWEHDVGLGARSRASIRADLVRTNDAIRKAAPGARVSYYRQPGGAWTASVVAVSRELGMTPLHWTVDPQDWRKPGAGSIASTVNSGTTRGAIILLHDAGGDRRGTLAALRSILPNLGRRFQLCALPPGIDPPRMHGREWPLKPGQI